MSEFARVKAGRPRTSSRPRTGRQMARYWVAIAGRLCERCQQAPARDRHHVDGNPLNNAPVNIQVLCRRCHMDVDGRLHGALRRTHCRNGHEFTDANTYTSPAGQRYCRSCRAAARRAREHS